MRMHFAIMKSIAALALLLAMLPITPQAVTVAEPALPAYVCGDADGNGFITISDAVSLIAYICIDGPAPSPVAAGDADGCGTVNFSDIIYLRSYIFSGGPAPCAGGITCYYPAGGNRVSLCHPVRKTIVDGDSVAISIYLENDTVLAGFSLGFSYNSNDIEVSSVSFDGSIIPGAGPNNYRLEPADNEVLLTYGVNPVSIQSGGLIATLWVQIPIGTPAQVVVFDSAFVAPGGEFILCRAGGGSIVPAFENAYTGADMIIGNQFVCGDADNSGSFTISDAVWLMGYFFGVGSPPPVPAAADVDNSGRVNISDLAYMFRSIFAGGQTCDITDTYCYPSGGNLISLPHSTVHPVIDGDSVGVPVYLTNDVPLSAYSLGFRYNSNDIDVSSFSLVGSVVPFTTSVSCKLLPSTNEVLIYGVDASATASIPAQTGGLLGTMWFQVPLGTPPQVVDIDTTFIAPAGEFILTKAYGGTIAPLHGDCSQTAEIVLGKPYLCGDASGDGIVNITDAVAAINYIFRCASVPHPLVSADVNCDGFVNVTDVVYLINWIFGTPGVAPSPCDPDNDGTPEC